MDNSNSKRFNGGSKKKKTKQKRIKQNKANKYSDSTFKQSTCVQEIVLQEYFTEFILGKACGIHLQLFTSVLNIWMN